MQARSLVVLIAISVRLGMILAVLDFGLFTSLVDRTLPGCSQYVSPGDGFAAVWRMAGISKRLEQPRE